ncbi:hypothetical protein [Micromonospora orduensis]|uniref:hypothetical protein n=1 Tax=Micromonospora orduensis TaxID=1420891 RepID=UPI0033C7A922
MSTCTIVTEFLGIELDPCGLDATHTSTGQCERGHTRTRHICTNHARAFTAVPESVVCAQCAEEGHDTQMVVTTEGTDRA